MRILVDRYREHGALNKVWLDSGDYDWSPEAIAHVQAIAEKLKDDKDNSFKWLQVYPLSEKDSVIIRNALFSISIETKSYFHKVLEGERSINVLVSWGRDCEKFIMQFTHLLCNNKLGEYLELFVNSITHEMLTGAKQEVK